MAAPQPSLKQVMAFLSVARHLHFTAAAQELCMSQPAVTSQIGLLEEQLGVKLFDRTKREVALTPAGRSLLPIMQRLAQDMDDLVAASGDLSNHRRGPIRLAVLPSIAASVLPVALTQFRHQNPNVDIEIFDVVADAIIDMVIGDDVDFGVGIRLTAERSLIAEPLMTDRLCVFCPEDHPLTLCPAPLSLRDCTAYPLIVTKRNSSVRTILARATMRIEGGISIAVEANYMSSALGAVRAGLGVAILPMAARDSGSIDGLTQIALSDPTLTRHISLLTHANRSVQPAAADLMVALRTVAADAGDLFQPA